MVMYGILMDAESNNKCCIIYRSFKIELKNKKLLKLFKCLKINNKKLN